MVKGVAKQVILVRPQEEALFEQAIFIVRDGAAPISEQELLAQAREAADGPERRRPWLPYLAFCGGAAVMAAVWLLTVLL